MPLFLRLVFFLAVLAGAVGCDVGGDGSSPSESAFEARAAVDAPASVRAGEPFEAVVMVEPRLSGVGTVRISSQVGLLRVLAPVADTLDLTDVSANGVRGVSHPVRVVLQAGQPVRVAWTLAVDQAAPILNPGVGAVVRMDSVRTADGRLVDVETYAPVGGFVWDTYAEVRPVRVVGG